MPPPLTVPAPTAAAGTFHCVVVREGGVLYGWGANGAGRAVPPAGICRGRKARSVAAGEMHSLAILDDGSVVAWGKSDARIKVPKLERRAVAVSAGSGQSMALLSNGSVVGWGHNLFGEARPPKLTRRASQVSCGRTHSLILLDNGNILTVGTFPLPDVPPFAKAVRVAAGATHSLAILDDNSILGWGDNSCEQATAPRAPEGRTFTDISAGGKHSVALLDDGTVLCWGYSGSGRTHTPAFRAPVVCVSAGGLHSAAIDERGEVYVWGYSGNGQAAPPEESFRAAVPKKRRQAKEKEERRQQQQQQQAAAVAAPVVEAPLRANPPALVRPQSAFCGVRGVEHSVAVQRREALKEVALGGGGVPTKALPPLKGQAAAAQEPAVEEGVEVGCLAEYGDVDAPPELVAPCAIEVSDLPQPPVLHRPVSAKRCYPVSTHRVPSHKGVDVVCVSDFARHAALPHRVQATSHPIFATGSSSRPAKHHELADPSPNLFRRSWGVTPPHSLSLLR